jgi:hypothetical protein
MLVRVIAALGTTAPAGSKTVPVIPPRLVCAETRAATKKAQLVALRKDCNKAFLPEKLN